MDPNRPPLSLAAAPSASTPTTTPIQHSPYGPSPLGNGYQSAAAETAQAALSEQATATPNANGRKRKASGVPGSRGVANLTPDQLAKKRANDREAQRAIRERTRKQIEGLEQRIKELESQQPFQELQRAIQERDRALNEVEELEKRLEAVAGIVGASHPGLHDLANLTATRPPRPPQIQQQQQGFAPGYQSSPQPHHVYGNHHLHPDLRSPHERHRSEAGAQSQSTSAATSPHESGSTVSRAWSTGNDLGPNNSPRPTSHPYEQHRALTAQMQQPSSGERLGLNFVLDTKQQHSNTNSPHTEVPRFAPPPHDIPIYLRTPSIGPSTCPLDSLLGDFLFAGRHKLKAGVPKEEVLGPAYPDFCALADTSQDPERYRDCHPLSKLLIDILSTTPDLSQPPEKVSIIYVMFLTMRWLICPCQSCFDRLPVWIRPVQEQIDTPHGTWIDHLPWPTQRTRLILAKTPGTAVKFEDFFVPFTTTMSVNWPYERGNVLVPTGGDGGIGQDYQLLPEFEVHLKTLSNWSVGTQFKNAYPELVDESMRVEDRGS